MRKTLNVKIPIEIFPLLDDRAQLNPEFIAEWLSNTLFALDGYIISYKGLDPFYGVNYSLKVNEPLINHLKAIACINHLSILDITYLLFLYKYER